MSEVRYYHVTESGLVEGTSLGRITVVLASDYYAAVTDLNSATKKPHKAAFCMGFPVVSETQ